MYDISKLGNDYKIESIVKDYQDKYPLVQNKTVDINLSTILPNNTPSEIKEDGKDEKFLKKKRSHDDSIVEKKN
jgi:hypothetical protein